MYEVGGIPDKSKFSKDTTIQSIIIKILGDSTSLDHDTTLPNTRYEVKNLGTWSSIKDVDNFLNKCNHATGYYGATIGSYVTIKDGTYNKTWVIVGFDCEHKATAADGSIYDNGYGIFMIPTTAFFEHTVGSMKYNKGYMHTGVHNNINKYLASSFANNNGLLENHLISRRMLLSNSSSGFWTNDTVVESRGYEWTTGYGALMSAGQITGKFAANKNKYDDGEANYKLPYFNFNTWQFGDYSLLRGLAGTGYYNDHNNNYDKPFYVSNGSVLGNSFATDMSEINDKKPGIFPLIMIR